VREAIERPAAGSASRGGTILFIDEVHRFNKAQQDALLPSVEDGLIVLIGATTENPFFSVNSPLLSRSTLWRLEPLTDEDLGRWCDAALDGRRGRGRPTRPSRRWCRLADGDARAALGTLEVALALAGSRPRRTSRTWSGPEPHGSCTTGPDSHYDQISAFIKSIRGSDPDAGLYWLARMLAAGEDARFIARRLVILASEDVGDGRPLALVVADAAARAVEFVGLPEAQLNLAQAVVHLATAPKSNRVTVGPLPGRAEPRIDVAERAPAGRRCRQGNPPARRPLPHRARRPTGTT
jgi:putative ATPase